MAQVARIDTTQNHRIVIKIIITINSLYKENPKM